MTTLQLQRLGDFGSAGQGVGHGAYHERTAIAVSYTHLTLPTNSRV